MNYPAEVRETDILIIGGGVAGARAAIEADEHRARIIMVMKAKVGQGGTSASPRWYGGFCIPNGDTDPSDSPDEWFKDIMRAGLGMCDEKLVRILANETIDRVNELEKWGFVSPNKVNGQYQQFSGVDASHPRNIALPIRMATHGIMGTLKQQIEKRNITVADNVVIVSLLTRSGNCIGALGVDRNGHFLVFTAKSTVLATGGGAAVFPPHYDAGATGDGYALGFNAGAELMNMEFLQISLGSAPADPELYSMPMGLRPDIYNITGERFLPRYLPEGVTVEECFSKRKSPFRAEGVGKYLDIAIYKEILEGRGTENRGIYMDFTGVPEKDYKAYLEKNKLGHLRFQAGGRKLLEKPLQIGPRAQAFNGGLRINESGETTVPGLYAVGEVASGTHGANRLGGGLLPATQVFGARAGRFAAEKARGMGKITIDQEQLDEECGRASKIISNKRGAIWTADIESKVRDIMWRSCLTVRNQKGLENCVEELKRIRHEELPKLFIGDDGELFRALSIPHMLDTAVIVAYAALQRKESRGPHYREDYQDQDDKNWLKTINISKENLDLG